MRRAILPVAATLALAAGCQAQVTPDASVATSSQAAASAASEPSLRDDVYERAKRRNGGKEPTKLELLNELIDKGIEQSGPSKRQGKRRVVAKGAVPEISLNEGRIAINGKPLSLRDQLGKWVATLPGTPVCYEKSIRTLCVWDELGVVLATQSASNKSILEFTIHINLEPPDSLQGSSTKAAPNYRPAQAFPGYLELDGHGIDARTRFWELRSTASPARNLRCSARDCSHPHGAFNETANLYMRLNSSTEDGELYEFTVSEQEELPTKR